MRCAALSSGARLPCSTFTVGRTKSCFASASSAVSTGGSTSYSTRASFAARRAASIVVAATAKSGWPWNSTSSAANSGSSGSTGPMLFAPGMSAGPTTATTPGARRTGSRSSFRMRACACVERPIAA